MLLNCGVGEDLRVPWTSRRSNQSILKEISPEYSLEGLMLKLKLQYLATWCKELTHLNRPWCWERLKVGGEGTTEDEMAGWHHQLDGHEFEWTLGVGDGQGGLACCDSWGRKESDTTKWLEFRRVLFRSSYRFSSKEQVSFNFMAAVTICSDFQFSSDQFSHLVVSDSLRPHES